MTDAAAEISAESWLDVLRVGLVSPYPLTDRCFLHDSEESDIRFASADMQRPIKLKSV